ncbi:MAG: ASCH domain-containing protein [Pyrinomonadaceae bacterium]
MGIPKELEAFWLKFASTVDGVLEDRFYEAFYFGDSGEMAAELAALVLEGKKRATASALWTYESTGKPLPKIGDLSVITDFSGRPHCAIETTEISIVPFIDVTEDFAAAEGEGDCSLGFWRDVHEVYFKRECENAGREFDASMPVVCERFEVVFVPDGA